MLLALPRKLLSSNNVAGLLGTRTFSNAKTRVIKMTFRLEAIYELRSDEEIEDCQRQFSRNTRYRIQRMSRLTPGQSFNTEAASQEQPGIFTTVGLWEGDLLMPVLLDVRMPAMDMAAAIFFIPRRPRLANV